MIQRVKSMKFSFELRGVKLDLWNNKKFLDFLEYWDNIFPYIPGPSV